MTACGFIAETSPEEPGTDNISQQCRDSSRSGFFATSSLRLTCKLEMVVFFCAIFLMIIFYEASLTGQSSTYIRHPPWRFFPSMESQ